MQYKITFIGSGNVATNLAHAFDKAGHTINQVIGRDVAKAKELASKFGAYYGDKVSTLYNDSDFIIVCVSDDAYRDVIADMPKGMRAIVCHTAGAVPMSEMAPFGGDYGVIYPLQSLRKEEPKNLMEVPIFVEWSAEHIKSKVFELADSISNKVVEVNSENRAKYHLAAVFANNFTNLMYVIADEYLEKEGLDFKHLLPIIKETALRVKSGKPSDWQTGPAKRGDKSVIDSHISQLPTAEIQEIYAQLSKYLMTK